MNQPTSPANNKKKWRIFALVWFVIFLFYASAANSTNLLSLIFSVLLILPIRFFGDKQEKKTTIQAMIKRLKECRPKHKTRTIVSGVLFIFFFIPSVSSIAGNIKAEKDNLIKQEAYNNAPTPSIEILSQTGNIGNSTGYILKYNVKNASNVIINGTKAIFNSGDISNKEFSLDGTGKDILHINIIASNEYKKTDINLTISRNKTNEEIKIAQAEKEKAERLAKAEREAKEKADRVAKEQARKTEISNRKTYGDILRNRFLDQGLDITVSVKGKDNTTLALKYALFSDVWARKMQTEGLIEEYCLMGFQYITLQDGWNYGVKFTCNE